MSAVLVGSGAWVAPGGGGGDPGGDVLLYEANVTGSGRYLGSFRVPADPGMGQPKDWSGGAGMGPGGGGFWFNPAGNEGAGSLIVAGRNAGNNDNVTPPLGYGALLTEISIPGTFYNGGAVPTGSTYRGGFLLPSPYFYDITEGNVTDLSADGPGDGLIAGGVFIYNGNLYQNWAHGYQGTGFTLSTHFKRTGTAPNAGTYSGPYVFASVDVDASTAVSTDPLWYRGCNALIPTAWQTALGGPMIQAQTQYSNPLPMGVGPALFSFDPEDIGVTSPVPNTCLMGYSPTNYYGEYTEGATSDTGWVRGTSRVAGVVFPSGSSTVLVIYAAGTGILQYGNTNDEPYINDPAAGLTQGWHAWPYRVKIAAYDANDLAAVKAETMQPYEVLPYSTWQIDPPDYTYLDTDILHFAVAYDDANKRLFLMERETSRSIGDPIIHVYQMSF